MSRGVLSILIVENHQVLLEALRLALENEPGLKARIRTCAPENALQSTRRHRPDILLYSLGREESELPQLFAALQHAHPALVILALTHPDAPDQGQTALENGAQAALIKYCSRAELIHTLRILSTSNSSVGGSK